MASASWAQHPGLVSGGISTPRQPAAHPGLVAGNLQVTLCGAEDLKDVDWGGKQDPYCVLTVGNRSTRSNTHTDGGTNPVWNQVFEFKNVANHQELKVQVFDENLVFRDVAIGTCSLPLQAVCAQGAQDVRLPVMTKKGKHRGDVICRLVFTPTPIVPMPGASSANLGMASNGASAAYRTVPSSANYPSGANYPSAAYSQRDRSTPPQAGPLAAAAGYASQASYMQPQGGMPPAYSGQQQYPPQGYGQPQASMAAPSPQPRPLPKHEPKPLPQGNWILPTYANKDCWRDYEPGQVLGKGTYGTTYLAHKKDTREKVAIKVISKRKLSTPEEIEDVQREVKIMHHLSGHPNVVMLKDVYEDRSNVCLVMELCSGGELFDVIIKRGTYTERDAAMVMRTIVSVVAHCHHMGVIHRDLKPENFLLTDKTRTAQLKTADFGLSTFFQEDQLLTDIVGSAFYVAPEVLKRCYGKEADIWSCGVILYILLCGTPPFQGDREHQIFNEVANKPIDLSGAAWDRISAPAKDCVRRMLVRDPRKRVTAAEILKHEWLRENGVAQDNPLELEVLTRMKKLNGMNKLKKEALRVIAGSLPVDEISGLQAMFMEIDKDKSGTITVEEFAAALKKKGQAIRPEDMALIMSAADLNGDGSLDYEEFLAAMINQAKLQQEENLKKAFEHFDLDGNGFISRQELYQALRDMHINDSQIQTIIDEVDSDGNGQIDYNEFCVMMRGR